MSEHTIIPRFDFSNIIPGSGPGQNHTRSKVPNNSLAPEKFNEYERVMVELANAVGDYGFSTIIPGASDNVGSAIQTIWNQYYTNVPGLMTHIHEIEDSMENLGIQYSSDIASLSSIVQTYYETLHTTKFDKAGGTITGPVTISNTFTVNNTSVLAGVTTNGLLIANNGLTVNNALLSAMNGLSVTGTGSISSNLTINGKLSVNGASGIEVSTGSVTIDKNITVHNNGTFGGTVHVSGRVTSFAISIAWASARNYAAGDIVLYDGTLYVCMTPHVSDSMFAFGNWNYVTSASAGETIVESMIDSTFLKEIKTDPIGTVKLYDGAVWEDNNTIPGWYACTGEEGTPDLRDSFIMAGDSDDRGYCGGAEAGGTKHTIQLAVDQLPLHDHSLNAHTHTVPIDHDHGSETFTTENDGSHSHTVNCISMPSFGTETAINATIIKNANIISIDTIFTTENGAHIHDVTTDIAELVQNNTSLGPNIAQSGQTGSGSIINITPYYYKMLIIKRMR